MYVTWEKYHVSPMAQGVSEQDYPRLSAYADALIDGMTLNRVGRAVGDGLELPDEVERLYCAIVTALPSAIEEMTSVGGELTSFSNGVDSYSFSERGPVQAKMEDSLSCLIDALPLCWTSVAVGEPGRCWHDC